MTGLVVDKYLAVKSYFNKYTLDKSDKYIVVTLADEGFLYKFANDVDALKVIYDHIVSNLFTSAPEHARYYCIFLYYIYRDYPWSDNAQLLRLVREEVQARSAESKRISYLKNQYVILTMFSMVHFPQTEFTGLLNKLNKRELSLVEGLLSGNDYSKVLNKVLQNDAYSIADNFVIRLMASEKSGTNLDPKMLYEKLLNT